MKNNKGITMISLVITIIVLIIVTSITIHNGMAQLGIKRVNSLYADIDSISTKVAEYYLKNDKLPVFENEYIDNQTNLEKLFKENGATTNITNVNDKEGAYYVIDLTKLDNLTLNYGDDYKKWTNTSTAEKYQNIYIINSVTHQIYFPHGVRLGEEYYFAKFPDENEIKAVELGEIEGELEVRITNIYANTLGDNKLSILANLTFEGELNNYDLNNLEYAWSEIHSEIENINLSYTKFQATSTNETSANAVISSKGLSDEVEHYYLYIRIKDNNGKYSYQKFSKPYSVITGKLPKGYQQVEYIESTGTQWISTSYIPTVTEDMKIELEYMFTAQQTGDSFLFGSKNNGAAVQCQKYSHARWYCASGIYNFRNLLSSCGGELNKKYSLIMDKNLLTIDGQSVNNTSTTSGDAVPLYIFAGNWNGKTQFINTGARIYKLTFTANGILEANFIPCYKKAENSENNKPGLYNLLEGKFYTNQGTGVDFTVGNDVY